MVVNQLSYRHSLSGGKESAMEWNIMKRMASISLLALSAACVTINVYFPAVAAEKAADRIIDNVWGEESAPATDGSAEKKADETSALETAHRWVADFGGSIIGTAHAQANIDVSSPAIQAITKSMEGRHGKLAPHYASGAIGLTANGEVALRDANAVSLKDRNTVRKLVADENADRRNLYREIASANGHPEWEADIRNTFAKRWISKAKGGWYYQNAEGGWNKK